MQSVLASQLTVPVVAGAFVLLIHHWDLLLGFGGSHEVSDSYDRHLLQGLFQLLLMHFRTTGC